MKYFEPELYRLGYDIAPRRAPEQIDAGSQPSVRFRRRVSRRSSETVSPLYALIFSRFRGGRRRATRAPKAICALCCSHHLTPLLTKCPNILQPTGYPTRGKYYNQPRVHTTSHHFLLNAHMYLYFVGRGESSSTARVGVGETYLSRSVFQRGSSLQQSTDEMLSSVFEYVKGATTSRCEEAETPAVAVS